MQKMKETKDVFITVRVPRRLRKAVAAKAARVLPHATVAAYIRRLFERDVKRKG